MPVFETGSAAEAPAGSSEPPAQFPSVTRDHILNCSYDAWFPRYRTSCLKSSIIRLSPEFVGYLREDGIILADEESESHRAEGPEDDWEPSIPTGVFRERAGSDSDTESEDGGQRPAARLPPNLRFPELHQRIKDEIKRLGGQVVPKLNWSSPKDATWIMMDKNTMRCTTPDDVYLLLKSSSFISHDLENAFDNCISAPQQGQQQPPGGSDLSTTLGFTPVLVLRPYFKPQTALEFRCFVKQRSLVAISQRDMKHYPFLDSLRDVIIGRVRELFVNVLRFTFPDGSFVFDVYIPEGSGGGGGEADGLSRARLIDINPWAPRTDSLLFDWGELLDIRVSRPVLGTRGEDDERDMGPESQSDTGETTDDEDAEDGLEPELRLVSEDDPITSNLLSSQYSAHKLPKDVVDASAAGEGGLRVFAEEWRRMVESSSNS